MVVAVLITEVAMTGPRSPAAEHQEKPPAGTPRGCRQRCGGSCSRPGHGTRLVAG
jgi:hypothetical protein